MGFPAYRWIPEYETTNGDLAAQVGAELGMAPDAEQQMIEDAIFAETKGTTAMFEVAAISPRQNLKTAALEIAALTDLFVLRVPLTIWTAHLVKTARMSFEHMVALIESKDDYRKRCKKPREANGSEAIQLLTGERIEFYARSRGGGRGRTASRITLDEALFLTSMEMGALLPTLATIEGAQVRYGSSAGMELSEVLRGVRDRGRVGNDAGLGYLEWCARRIKCEQRDCPHLPADGVPGCVLDRRDLWAEANPAYGRRIAEKALMQFRRSMTPAEFMREFLGWWEDPADVAGLLVPTELWDSRGGATGELVGNRTFGLAVAEDHSWSAVSTVKLRDDGLRQIELLANRPGTEWVPEYLKDEVEQDEAVAINPTGPAGALILRVAEQGVTVVEVAGRDYAQACGEFLNAIIEGSVSHRNDAALDQAVRMARTRPVAEAWIFSQRSSTVDISPLTSAVLALHLYQVRYPARYDLMQSFF